MPPYLVPLEYGGSWGVPMSGPRRILEARVLSKDWGWDEEVEELGILGASWQNWLIWLLSLSGYVGHLGEHSVSSCSVLALWVPSATPQAGCSVDFMEWNGGTELSRHQLVTKVHTFCFSLQSHLVWEYILILAAISSQLLIWNIFWFLCTVWSTRQRNDALCDLVDQQRNCL